MIPYNKRHTELAQKLRKSMTPEEKHLWYDVLKRLPMGVKRQYSIGQYIVDFYIPSKKIAIELDGIQHKLKEHKQADAERDQYLASWGIRVLRYSNSVVHTRFRDVVSDLLQKLDLTLEDLK